MSIEERVKKLLYKDNIAYIIEWLEDSPDDAITILVPSDEIQELSYKLIARLQKTVAFNTLIDKLIKHVEETQPEQSMRDTICGTLLNHKVDCENENYKALGQKIDMLEKNVSEITSEIKKISELNIGNNEALDENSIINKISAMISEAVKEIEDSNSSLLAGSNNIFAEKIQEFATVLQGKLREQQSI